MSVEYKDYYKVLGVSKDASLKDIKQVYKKLARQYHPDINKDPGSEAKFKEINEAYEVLSDNDKRKKYDELGKYWKEGQGGYGAYQGGYPGVEFDFRDMGDLEGGGDFSDFFNVFFGRGAGHRDFSDIFNRTGRKTKGEDLNYLIQLSLPEAYFGCSKSINIIKNEGRSKKIEVKVPAGVVNGTKIRLKGEGSYGSGGHGDLYLEIKLIPHPVYDLKDRDIYADIPISVSEAVLGSQISIPYLKGKLSMKIPPLTQTGKIFRISGHGMPSFKNSPAGNLYLRVKIVIPKELNEEEKKIYTQLSRFSHENPRANWG